MTPDDLDRLNLMHFMQMIEPKPYPWAVRSEAARETKKEAEPSAQSAQKGTE
jgi:hypothetical protein